MPNKLNWRLKLPNIYYPFKTHLCTSIAKALLKMQIY